MNRAKTAAAGAVMRMAWFGAAVGAAISGEAVSFSDKPAAIRRAIPAGGFSHWSTLDTDLRANLWALIVQP